MSMKPGPVPGPAAPQAAEESPGAGRGGDSPAARSLAGQVHALRVLAGVVEQAGIPGLDLAVEPGDGSCEITIHVPRSLGSLAQRTAMVGRLAATVGAPAAASGEHEASRGRSRADGQAGGHPVHIFTAAHRHRRARAAAEKGPRNENA